MEFFTWETLATSGGAIVLVTLVVQFTKIQVDKILKIPTRAYVYILSAIILILANVFTGNTDFNTLFKCLADAVVVSAGAMGAYEVVLNRGEKETP